MKRIIKIIEKQIVDDLKQLEKIAIGTVEYRQYITTLHQNAIRKADLILMSDKINQMMCLRDQTNLLAGTN